MLGETQRQKCTLLSVFFVFGVDDVSKYGPSVVCLVVPYPRCTSKYQIPYVYIVVEILAIRCLRPFSQVAF